MSRVVIIGGGASGLLVAVNLLRMSDSCEVLVVEPNESLGRGVAYYTKDPEHLLNVPAGRMSGLVEEPRSLCDWASVDENAFVSRQDYGRYLNELLDRELKRVSPSRFTHIKSRVVDIESLSDGYKCHLESGNSILADKIALALGNSDSIVPAYFSKLPTDPRVVS